jgi:NitT/TauT family transport system permease protein
VGQPEVNKLATIANGLGHTWMRVLSLLLLVVIWEVTAVTVQSRVLPEPWEVAHSFYVNLVEGSLLSDLGITLLRVLAAFILAMVIGTAIGIVMGVRRTVDGLLDGWLILFLNIPALVTIILCYVWFGLTEVAAVTAVALNKIPNVIVTVREGARAIDRDLLQVAEIFRVDSRRTFMRFFLPQLYPYLMVAGRSGIALIWKIVLVVELMGRSNGIGFQLNSMFQLFDIAGLMAYTLAFVAVMLLVEIGLVEPLERRMTRWRK